MELSTFWGWNYDSFIDFMLDRTDIVDSDRILDIATGTGVIPRKLHSRESFKYPLNALDITYKMLKNATKKSSQAGYQDLTKFTCASAMEMPYKNEAFTLVLCGLATHHMDVDKLLSEIHRILENDGKLVMADVGASPLWRIPGVLFFIRILAFIYFFFKENSSRAWAEAMSVKNIRTYDDWVKDLNKWGFRDIHVQKLDSKYKWIPSPLLIKAIK